MSYETLSRAVCTLSRARSLSLLSLSSLALSPSLIHARHPTNVLTALCEKKICGRNFCGKKQKTRRVSRPLNGVVVEADVLGTHFLFFFF